MRASALICGLGILMALFLAGACGGGESEAPKPPAAPAPVPTPSPPVAPGPETPTPPAPEPAAELDLASGDPEAGKAQYLLYCATCHGEDGAAQTPMALALDPRPANHADGTYMNPLSDEHVFKVIQSGGGAVGKSLLMTPWGGTLSDEEIVDVIAFIRTLANPPYQR